MSYCKDFFNFGCVFEILEVGLPLFLVCEGGEELKNLLDWMGYFNWAMGWLSWQENTEISGKNVSAPDLLRYLSFFWLIYGQVCL